MTDSSSAPSPRFQLDLLVKNRLPPIPTALLQGRDLDLLAPLRFLAPNTLPEGDAPRVDRAELAAALGEANAAYGHPAAAALAAKLADPATRVVVTGQQPGLYGGPLLSLTKMVAAVRWAEALEAAGQPAVAVFWVATEDHDWRELSRASFLTRDGERTVDLGEDASPLEPVGRRALGPGIAELEEEIAEALGSPLFADTFRDVAAPYHPDATFGEAFCGLVVELFGERAPLLLDSLLPGVKHAQRPWFEALIDHRREVDGALLEAGERLTARGYDHQVHHQAEVSPFFLIQGGERRRIVWEGEDAYSLRGDDAPPKPVAELRALIHECPECFSPGVLCRPALQDALLGSTLQIMGPSELSYLAQASAVYEVLGIDAPWTTLRPQILVVDERSAGYLEELDVTLEDLVETPVEQILTDRLGEDFVTPVRERIAALVGDLREPILGLDPTLEKPLQKTGDQIDRALDQLGGRVARAFAQKNEIWNRRLEQILELCRPGGHLQERHLAVAYYAARFGKAFVDLYWQSMDLDSRRLQGIVLP